MLGGKTERETVEKLAEIFDTSSEILKERGYELEEIVSLLRKYKLNRKTKVFTFVYDKK